MYLKAGGLALVVVLSFLAYFAFAQTTYYVGGSNTFNFTLVEPTDADPAIIQIKEVFK